MNTQVAPLTLRTLLGSTPRAEALKTGKVTSPLVALDFADVTPVTDGFPAMVRDQAYDFGELAIISFLQARVAGKPLVLLPAVVVGAYRHDSLVYNSARGELKPEDMAGKRVGVRAYTQTTGAWVRGVLDEDFGVASGDMDWVCFQEPHVREYREPDFVRYAPAGKTVLQMLLDGEIDAGIGVEGAKDHPQLKTVFPDPAAAAAAWAQRHGGIVPVNHMAVVSTELHRTRPDVVRELFRMLAESKAAAPSPAAGAPDLTPFGVEANRKSLELIIDYAVKQQLIPAPVAVDDLFDETTRGLVA